MLRPAQTLIASLLAIFIAFLVAFTSIIMLPQNFQTEPLELAILSFNETVRGCFVYAIDKKWNYFTSEGLTNIETGIQDIDQQISKYLYDCVKLTKSYIEKLYGIEINFSASFNLKDNVNHYNIVAFIVRNGYGIKTNYERNISIYINRIEIREQYPFKALRVNFTANGFMTSYLKVEVYFVENNFYKKVIEIYSLPYDLDKKYYVVEVGIEPKYLVKDPKEEKRLTFLVKVFDYDGASVWLKEEVSV